MNWSVWIQTAIAVVALCAVATGGLLIARIEQPASVVGALARAAVQLVALSFVLSGVIRDLRLVALALGVMFAAAVWTAARRSRTRLRDALPLAVAMLAGPSLVMLVVFGLGAIEFSARYLLAIGGIIIGNSMTIAILTQRLFRAAVIDHWDEVEGWLALGATPRQSTLHLGRTATRTALLPSIDQTRTTGIVVLPGAFVGAIFGGASPLEAGRFQLVVLAGILAAGVVTSTLLIRRTGAVSVKPE